MKSSQPKHLFFFKQKFKTYGFLKFAEALIRFQTTTFLIAIVLTMSCTETVWGQKDNISYNNLTQPDSRIHVSLKHNRTIGFADVQYAGVVIKNNTLYFTRSVTNEKERLKTGAREYFTQYYVGTYKENGKKIVGFYKSRGAKYLFEAYRKK